MMATYDRYAPTRDKQAQASAIRDTLDALYDQIVDALDRGEPVASLEATYATLTDDYERLCDTIKTMN